MCPIWGSTSILACLKARDAGTARAGLTSRSWLPNITSVGASTRPAARPDLVKTLTLVSPMLPDRRPHRSTAHFPILTLPFVGQALVRR